MKIFITGATGFIGKHLIKKLEHSGHEVICLVRSESKRRLVEQLGCRAVMGDVLNREALRQGMQGCDRVFHLANVYSMWLPDVREFDRVNITGTRNVMECALDCGIARVVYISTVAVYGEPAEKPFNEDSQPGERLFSAYAKSKAAADDLSWKLHRERGLPLVALYPGIVLGAGDDKASGSYIQTLINRRTPSTIFNWSEETYVYVGDVVDAILRASALDGMVGQRYLIGREHYTGRKYAEMISDISGVPLPWFQFPDPILFLVAYLLTGLSAITRMAPWWGLSIDAAWTLKKGFIFDGRKAERELGIQYTPIEFALREAIESYRTEKKPHRLLMNK